MEHNLFLTDNELIQLTGYKIPSKQCEWLVNKSVVFYKNRLGRPNVPRYLFQSNVAGIKTKEAEPDFSSML